MSGPVWWKCSATLQSPLVQRHIPAVEASAVGAVPTTRILKGSERSHSAFLHLFFTNQKYLRSFHQRSDRTQEAVANAFCFFHYHVQMLQSTDWKLYMAGQ